MALSRCMTNVLSFKFEKTDEGAEAILPCVDGVGLDQLVAEFERTSRYNDPAGGYGGLIPSYYFFGPLPSYFLGQEEPVIGDDKGEIYVLSCECGEVGCWPLVAHVRLHEDKVVWDGFSQPHRPSRNYENFGPFVFERKQYEKAVEALVRYDDL
ncbi:hypothetical protein GR243_24375 [Rhizobium leguminosarum]|nr:hypothetical protein [Rhizobium leguminosarum]TBE31179.1 hypothetical protein ELH05_24850 [Rhizobium ruizarguesonis]